MTQLDTNALFTQYVNVVNKAIGAHRDETPYKQIIQASDKLMNDKTLGVAIYKDDASTPHDWFTLKWNNGGLKIDEHGKKPSDISWKANEAHLEEVVEKPNEFIEHPMKLDLDWLKKRLQV